MSLIDDSSPDLDRRVQLNLELIDLLPSYLQPDTSITAVEKQYRNSINSQIAALADLVPALQHLRSLHSGATSRHGLVRCHSCPIGKAIANCHDSRVKPHYRAH
ncbi:hypothetical protein PSHT_15722 [Puccinia striiformis]|uniref:Uncharacterized protein n=2 Tax=Puccinia striiformis TaxID=27350 RepID=A0A2S4UDH8_9BASI|nr:hypothetical protein PSHT_15722 [Puccinia striiformis]POW00284.1 hypothetical protein PSTT_13244 [Puccinia striiformis]